MFKRQTEGSVICTSCGVLVGVNDDKCYNCGRRNPGLWGYGPALRRLGNDLGFVNFVSGATIVLYALSLVMSREAIQVMLAPSTNILLILGASGALPVVGYNRWWTVLTAGWLHAGILHIFFNVMWIRQLAPEIANLYGAGRMVIIYTAAGVVGFAFTTFMYTLGLPIPFFGGAYVTVGASAPIFGLLGALVYYGRRTGSSHIGQAGLQYALIMGVMGFVISGVDNSAHLGGFAGGYLMSWFLDPLKPERIDHLAVAVGCLVATAVAFAASILTVL
jgi:rhomboid protease GluP